MIALPRGATPIDFAYFVHTDVGNTAVGAKNNANTAAAYAAEKRRSGRNHLPKERPVALWGKVVATGARAEIRRYLRNAQRDQHVMLGRKILEKVFVDEGHELTAKAVEEALKKLRSPRPTMSTPMSEGGALGPEVLQAVYPELKRELKRKRPSYVEPNGKGVSIAGLTEGVGYRLGNCCHPIPGDRIIGLMVPGEGVVIHTVDCDVLDRHQDSMADWVDVRWRDHLDALAVARIIVRLKNTPGALAALANVISQNGANISNLKITTRNPLYFEFQVDVEVRDAAHLENLMRACPRAGISKRRQECPARRSRAPARSSSVDRRRASP